MLNVHFDIMSHHYEHLSHFDVFCLQFMSPFYFYNWLTPKGQHIHDKSSRYKSGTIRLVLSYGKRKHAQKV